MWSHILITLLVEGHGSPFFLHYHAMDYTVPAMVKLLLGHDEKILFKDHFFEHARRL